jgi:mono/diheme cytochrome c family protein
MLKAKPKTVGVLACLMVGAFGVSACRQDMHDNPKYKAYRDGGMRQLPEGVVARGSLNLNPAAPKVTVPAPQATPAGAQASASPAPQPIPTGEDGFPFKLSENPEERKAQLTAILDRGENRFNISCSPCHGKFGDGTGMIVQRGFKRPPSYHEERLRKAPSSYFYDVMTNGFGAMPSYTDQLTPEDRWKVIAYIRVLQLSQRATLSELAENVKQDIEKKAEEAASKKGNPAGGTTTPAPAPASGGHRN